MGRLARDGLHPDQNPGVPVGVWCDAAWSAYAELLLSVGSAEHLDALTETWDALTGDDELMGEAPRGEVDEAGRLRPTEAERAAWGTDARSQSGAANLATMMGGAAPGTGGG